MIRRRIEWLLILIASAVLYLFDNGTATLALLAACICAPVFSWGLVALSGRHLQISFAMDGEDVQEDDEDPGADEEEEAEEGSGRGKRKRNKKRRKKERRDRDRRNRRRSGLFRRKGNKDFNDPFGADSKDDEDEGYKIRFTIRNPDIMPVSGVEARVRCTNLRTGENEFIVLNKSVAPRGVSENTFTVKPSHAGRYEIAVDSLKILDPLQLWGRKKEINDDIYITVMPDIVDMALTVTSSAASMPESDRYRDGKRGNDPGEVLEIREYTPGDSIKNIHWKLSEKTDKLLVKVLGIPVTDQFMVILDNAADVGLNPDALDSIASVYASVLSSLSDSMMPFTAGWTDPATGLPVFRKVMNDHDLAAASDEYLAIPAVTQSAFEKIEREIIDSRFAHLIIVGSRIPDGLNSITNGCQVTILMYGTDMSGKTDEGATFIGFDEQTYKTELAGIEV